MIVEAAGFKWIDEGQGDGLGPAHEGGEVEDTLMGLLKPGGVFLDVGAHVGHYSLRASRVCQHVIAVEPNPATVRRLCEHRDLNGIFNLSVYELAAWDERTSLYLHQPNGQTRDGSTRVLPDAGAVKVQAAPLDDMLGWLGQLDTVKLDVEGADLHALRGMRGLIAKHKPVLFIEDHAMYGYYDRADLMALLEGFGYTVRPGGTYGGALYWVAEPD